MRVVDEEAEFLLVHPGGPFWAKKDSGAWSIPKGEYGPEEQPLACAKREFREELGCDCPAHDLIDIGEITQSGGKHVIAWCGVGEIDTAAVRSNMFDMQWPPRSGRMQQFPEVDRAAYFAIGAALEKIIVGQRPFLDAALIALRHAGLIP